MKKKKNERRKTHLFPFGESIGQHVTEVRNKTPLNTKQFFHLDSNKSHRFKNEYDKVEG